MNLHEDIQRIKEVMGFIAENNNISKIQAMIDELGISKAIKFFGGYDNIKSVYGDELFNKDNKINFIKEYLDEHKHYLRYGNLFTDYNESPILFHENERVIEQIESLDDSGAFVDIYVKPSESWVDGYLVPYEELPDEILEEIFSFIASISEE